ncbi:autotransporter-associated beta strand protein [Lelliottia sp. 489]|uniref:beta strand repeat-containing protein n=1 Tax=Lelliottia sp. 489 TaxID=3156448 RepID=UPI003D21FA6E
MKAFIFTDSQKLLLAGVLVISLPDGWAATNLPTSSSTLTLQNLSSTETSFILADTAAVTTSQGNGVNGDGSRNWQLTIQGVVDAAGSGVSLSSLDGQTTINNLGGITGHAGGASNGGVVLLNGGKLVKNSGATVTGSIGFNAVNGHSTLDNAGIITGTEGTAVQLSGGSNSVTLRSGTTLNGSMMSNSPGNTLRLEGIGRVTGDVGGTTGFNEIAVSGKLWELGGNVMLSGNTGSSLDIAAGSDLIFPGILDSRNRNNSMVNIAKGGQLEIGVGSTSGNVLIPVVNNGKLTFYRSDTVLKLTTPVSGSGEIMFKGTGVNGQSSYDISLPVDGFVGTVTVGNGARLHLNPTTFAPKALFAVNDGGTLWLGSGADYGAPVTLKGLGWKEISGIQYGALRMDSNPVLSGTVLLTGDARMTAIFSDYSGTISGVITDNGKGYQLEKYGEGLITLSGDNTWTGGMLLTGGTLAVSKDSNLGADSGTLVFNGGTLSMTDSFASQRALRVNSAGGTTIATGTNTFAGGISGIGPLTISSGKLVLAGNDTRMGTTTIASGAQLQIGSNDIANAGQGTLSGKVTNNGTLTFNRTGSSTSTAVLSGSGALIKEQTGLVNLTGAGASQGSVTVNGGTLMFSPQGAFTVSNNLITAAGGKTSVGASSQLNIGGTLIQQAGSAFEVAVNAQQPAAVAPTLALAGALNVLGAPVSASSITSKNINILHSTHAGGISGDFSSLSFTNPADYLYVTGSKLNGNQDYNLTFGMTWFADPSRGNGAFTLLDPTETFNVDVLLPDRTGPFTSGWDGQSLTKAGQGTLILSEQNSYTGNTRINGGTVQTNVENAFARSSAVSVAAGATLNLNDFSQSANNLSGAGAVKLGSATLTANNSQDTLFSGAITGSGKLVKEGGNALTLSGTNTFSGGASINAGTMTALTGAALGSGTITNNSNMTLAFDGNSSVVNLLVGNGTLNKEGNGGAVLLQTGSTAGEVNVNAGGLDLGSHVTMNVTGDYTIAPNAITRVAKESTLLVGDEFNVGGRLSVMAGGHEPVVTANTAVLGTSSTLNVAGMNVADGPGFTDYVKTFQVISTSAPGNMSGDFSAVHLGGATSPVDYASVARLQRPAGSELLCRCSSQLVCAAVQHA